MITPLVGKIQLKIEQPKVGNLDLSAKESAVEVGEVLAVGEGINNVKVGDKVMIKAWAIDILSYEGEKFYFIDSDSRGLCAIIN